jgi:hypothetical protein
MDRRSAGDTPDRPKHFNLRDLTVVAIAVAGIILANIGVVRALDVALDAIHR